MKGLSEMDYALKGWLWIIVGFLLIGAGGVFSTWGWDNINKKGQRDTLLFSLAREWYFNDIFLNTIPLAVNPNDPDLGKLHYSFPRFLNSAGDKLLSSSLLNDADLQDLLFGYFTRSIICNDAFDLWDDQLPSDSQQKRIEFYTVVNAEYKPLLSLRRNHRDLGEYLKANFPKQFKEGMKFGKNQKTLIP